MKYRIVIEIDTPPTTTRDWVNMLAKRLMDETITAHSNPIYLATEVVKKKDRVIFRDDE